MPRFPTIAAVREHLRNPTEAMLTGREEREGRIQFLRELAENPTLILSKGGRLVCYKHGGDWFVSAPGVARSIPTLLFHVTSRPKALLFAGLMENGIDLPWDGDELLDAMRAYPDTHDGRSAPGAILRRVAGHPVLDPRGEMAAQVAQEDASRARQERILARETAAGYTELIKVSEIEPGDEISYTYYGKLPYAWRNRGIQTDRDWMHLTVRGQVTDEGRVMTRHGNNHDEGIDGLRFKLAYGVWFDDLSDATGPLPEYAHVPTARWSARVLRKPKAAGK